MRLLKHQVRLLLSDRANWVLAARLLQNANGFFLSVILVRKFGLASAGVYALAAAAVMPIAILGTFGLPFSLARATEGLREKNMIGALACGLAMPFSLPLIVPFGIALGRTADEATAIALFACGGWFFAQVNVVNALLVLQGRLGLSIFPPLFNCFGIVTGTFFVDSLSGFALLLLIFRLVGIAATFCWLPMQSVSPTRFWAHLRPSLGFLSADLVNYGSGQILIVAISYMLSRDELGVIGLCRQIVGVADAPGWAMVQAAYPAIVADPISEVPRFYSRLVWLAGWTAIGFIALSVPLGLWVYRIPAFPLYSAILLATLPARYLLTLYETGLKAAGSIRSINRLAFARGVCWVAIVVPAVRGLPAVLVAFVVHAYVSSWATGLALGPARPGTQHVLR